MPCKDRVVPGLSVNTESRESEVRSSGEGLPTHVFLQGGVGGLAAAVISYLWEEIGGLSPRQAHGNGGNRIDGVVNGCRSAFVAVRTR